MAKILIVNALGMTKDLIHDLKIGVFDRRFKNRFWKTAIKEFDEIHIVFRKNGNNKFT